MKRFLLIFLGVTIALFGNGQTVGEIEGIITGKITVKADTAEVNNKIRDSLDANRAYFKSTDFADSGTVTKPFKINTAAIKSYLLSLPSAGAGKVLVVNEGEDGIEWVTMSGGTVLTPLSTPTLTATSVGSSQINLSWTNVANETGYVLQRSPNNSTWTTIYTAAEPDLTTYNNTGLTASTLYYYRVKAIGDAVTYGDSGFDTDNETTGEAGGNAYVTWNSLTSELDQHNSGKGLERTAGGAIEWGHIGWSNETLSAGQRLVIKLTTLNEGRIVGLKSTRTGDFVTSGTHFALYIENGNGISNFDNATYSGNAGHSISTTSGYMWLSIKYASNGTISYEKSTNGTTWVEVTSRGTGTGSYYIGVDLATSPSFIDEIFIQ